MRKGNNKLIILTPGFPGDERDTTCLPFLQNFVRELNRQFPLLDLEILTFDYPFIRGGYQWNENEVFSFNGWKKKNFNKLFTWLTIWKRMRKISRRNKVVGILSLWCNECAFLGSRFAKRNHLLHFCWIQGQDAKKENKYVSRIKPSETELIALSDFIQEEFKRNHGVSPQFIIPVGIRPAEFKGSNAARDIDILAVGSLIPLKQYHLFIEVIYNVKQYIPDVKALLCGKGPEENMLKGLIEKYDLQKNITLTGELTHEEILRTMSRSKIFLHPSNYEGLGVVCLEALYAGCRVISFVQPMHQPIKHWTVVQTEKQMFEKTRTLLLDPDTIFESVLTYTSAESAQKIMQLFNYNAAMSS